MNIKFKNSLISPTRNQFQGFVLIDKVKLDIGGLCKGIVISLTHQVDFSLLDSSFRCFEIDLFDTCTARNVVYLTVLLTHSSRLS